MASQGKNHRSPADIAYPTDLGLLCQGRKQTEKIIDKLYKPLRFKLKNKPRTYRKLARKNYLLVAKKRRPKKNISIDTALDKRSGTVMPNREVGKPSVYRQRMPPNYLTPCLL